MTGGAGRAAVAAGHPTTCDAAVAALEAGGNAFDAAVAAGFAAAVCEPTLTSLGGGGFLLARTAAGVATLFDFFSDTPGRGLAEREREPHFVPVTVRFPGSDQDFNVGHGSVAVPGTLRGLLHVHGRLGRIPLAEALAPAIAAARDGVVLNAHQSYFLGLLRPIVTMSAAGRALFAPTDELLREGETIQNPELAAFLEALPDGAERDFYEGGLARRVARDMHEGDGLLTAADLACYGVVERAPARIRYREATLLTNPPPSFGGTLLALSLRLLQAAASSGDGPDGAERMLALAGVMRATDAAREEELAGVRKSGGTTHVSICDAEGNAASMTVSNGEGSGYFVPGTGIMLNNMLGEDDLHPDGFHAAPPGERVASMMSPSLLLEDDELRLALGSGGSKRIRTALLQVVSRVVDSGLPLEAAVVHPRIHWDGATLQVEPGLPEPTLEALRAAGPVNVWDRIDVYFGGAHVAGAAGHAAGDPRRGGVARVL